MMPLFKGKKANMGISLFLGVILFNIIMYFIVWSANADVTVSSVGSGGDFHGGVNGTTNEDISSAGVTHWYSGFQVSVFDLPWWMDIIYVTLQAVLLGIGIYAMIRGLS